MEQIYDLIIIGGGPSGLCCAIASANAGLSVLLINNNPIFGGSLSEIEMVRDYPGFPDISGRELTSMFKEHADHSGVEYVIDKVISVELDGGLKTVYTASKDYSSVGVVLSFGDGTDACSIKGLSEIRCDKYITASENCKTCISQVYVTGNARLKPYKTTLSAISDGISAAYSYLDDIK